MTTVPDDVAAVASAARQDVVRSMAASDWVRASTKLGEAEAAFDAALEGLSEGPQRERLSEERALCDIHRADIAIRAWRVSEAEASLDRAYAILKKGTTEAELWRVTARIAERRGRWTPARAAWKKVIKLTGVANEGVVADAELRLAEIALHEGQPERCQRHLDAVRELGIDEKLVRIRGEVIRADLMAVDGDIDAALDLWRDISRDLTDLPQDFVALLNLRRAGAEVHRSPVAAVKRVLRAATLLDRVRHPDALGMSYGQLAVLATALRRPIVGALAAVGANASRTGDTIAHALLAAAVRQAELDVDIDSLEDRQLQEALVGVLAQPARELGVAWSDLGTLKGLEKLAEPLASIGGAGVRVDVESGMVVHSPALVGHRSSLTWDAPLGVLRTVVLAAPVVMPRRPALYRPPPSSHPPQPVGIPATPPPATPRTTSASWRESTELRLLAVVTGATVLGFAGLAVLVLFALLQMAGRQPRPTGAPVQPVVAAPTPTGIRVVADAGTGERVPVTFVSVQPAGVASLTGPGIQVEWGGGNGLIDLPTGTYSVEIGSSTTMLMLEGGACTVRAVRDLVVATCK